MKLPWNHLSHRTIHPFCLDKLPPSPWSQRRLLSPSALSPSPKALSVLTLEPRGWGPQKALALMGETITSPKHPPIPRYGAMLQITGWSCWCLSETCSEHPEPDAAWPQMLCSSGWLEYAESGEWDPNHKMRQLFLMKSSAFSGTDKEVLETYSEIGGFGDV